MIVRHLDTLTGSERVVSAHGWTSRRLLLRDDGMGFSLHDTVIDAGAELTMHYRNHLEAVYIVDGVGKLIDVGTGAEHPLAPGAMYALNDNDKHVLVAETRLRAVCVFNPPLVGPESHGEDGAYPLLAETAPSDRGA